MVTLSQLVRNDYVGLGVAGRGDINIGKVAEGANASKSDQVAGGDSEDCGDNTDEHQLLGHFRFSLFGECALLSAIRRRTSAT